MNIGIIGCGVIGVKRSLSLGDNKLIAVADINIENAKKLVANHPDAKTIKIYTDYKELLELSDIDIIIVSTINNVLAPITFNAIRSNKHVLVEKPVACNPHDIENLILASEKHKVKVKVGYTLRSHRAIIKAKNMIDANSIGEVMFIRARYGHGGRIGYDKEWRANPTLSGGGELMDQGVHLLDLSRFFLGDFSHVSGSIHTYFWNMPVDDNAFIHLRTSLNKTAWLHVSCTEWKNIFSFEIYGKTGKIHIEGLNGSYGTEKLTLYKMLPQMGPPETTTYKFPIDNSWNIEINDLVSNIKNNTEPHTNLNDALKTFKIVEEIYSQSLNTNK